MPQMLALGLFYLGAPAVITNGLVGIGVFGLGGLTPALVEIGLSFGLSSLAASFNKPQTPKPEDVQQSVRIQTSYRFRHYGTMKTSGNWLFCDTYSGGLDKVITLGQGKLTATLSYFIEDNIVTLDGNNDVPTPPYDGHVHIETRAGLPTETYYASLAGHFPEWTTAHRGDGMATMYIRHKDIDYKDTIAVFPKLTDTVVGLIGEWQELYDVTTGLTAHSDNAALVIRDYMGHKDGARMPVAELSTPLAIAAWQKAQARADVNIPLKAGGTEKQFRLWGSYHMGEQPAAVLGRMLACCDARPIVTRDGGLAIDIRNYDQDEVSSFVLDNSVITGFQGFGRGNSVLETANVVKATFLAVDHDWQTPEADPWIDEDDVANFGEKVTDRAFNMAPSHGQCRRLMKRESYRANPEWVGTFFCRPMALALFQEGLVPVNYYIGKTLVSGIFEITSFDIVLGENGILQGVTVGVQSMPLEAGTWNAATEEGVAPVAELSSSDNSIPDPTGFTLTLKRKNVQGVNVPFALIEFDPKPIASLLTEIRGRRVGDPKWLPLVVSEDDDNEVESFVLADGETYEFQMRYITARGRAGNWVPTPAPQLLAVSDPVAPIDLASFTNTDAAPHLGRADFNITIGNDQHIWSVRLYRKATGVPVNVALDTPISTIYAVSLGSYNVRDGDTSAVQVLLEPEMDGTVNWVEGTGWVFSTTKFVKSAGTSSNLGQTVAALSSSTAVWRVLFEVSAWTAGQFRARFTGGTAVNGTYHAAAGVFLDKLTANGGNNTFNIGTDSAAAGEVTRALMFQEAPAHAPQGVWDYVAIPFNRSGVAGPGTTVTVTVA
ncbi:hypothetical protein OIU34_26575 [Pararhizobium sp. BT-229]|uniref:hypothetical protein n=1 Tax=Pararhizobium sp. BT-229 TaxID=2986923 RepID=UPI0021F7D2A4|nr:hypothetical protein [Pararhizobium sp. BT-229]MCV9965448.1 hypothetical protein [Pararhizobium sp. BT-229]